MGYHPLQGGVLGAIVLFDLSVELLAILGNVLVLVAVINVKIGLVGFRRFLISLLANDIFMCVSQVFIAIYLECQGAIDRDNSCVSAFLESVKLFAVFAALFNLCGMSIDHLIGITHAIKYDYLMNTTLAKLAPFLIFIFAFIFAFADIPIAGLVYYIEMSKYDMDSSKSSESPTSTTMMGPPSLRFINSHSSSLEKEQHELDNQFDELSFLLGQADLMFQEETDWCLISHSYKIHFVQWFRLVCTVVVFLFLVACYGRIFYEIHHHEKGVITIKCASNQQAILPLLRVPSSNRDGSGSQNSHHNKSSRKFVIITLLLLTVFAICWLPFSILEIIIVPDLLNASQNNQSKIARQHLVQHAFNSLFLLYPLLDSIICVTRSSSVRRFIHQLLFGRLTKTCLGKNQNGNNHSEISSTQLPVIVINNSKTGPIETSNASTPSSQITNDQESKLCQSLGGTFEEISHNQKTFTQRSIRRLNKRVLLFPLISNIMPIKRMKGLFSDGPRRLSKRRILLVDLRNL